MNDLFVTELEKLGNELLSAKSQEQFEIAKKVRSTLERAYPNPETSFNKDISVLIGNMQLEAYTGTAIFNSNHPQVLYDIIQQSIYDLKKYKNIQPLSQSSPSINISNNLSQTQSQKQSQAQSLKLLMDCLENELTGKQYKELILLLNEKSEPEEKKKKIFEKIKSYGVDILAKIISSTITNPEILTSIIG